MDKEPHHTTARERVWSSINHSILCAAIPHLIISNYFLSWPKLPVSLVSMCQIVCFSTCFYCFKTISCFLHIHSLASLLTLVKYLTKAATCYSLPLLSCAALVGPHTNRPLRSLFDDFYYRFNAFQFVQMGVLNFSNDPFSNDPFCRIFFLKNYSVLFFSSSIAVV